MSRPIIATRADLDALIGTPEHTDFMALLAGSARRKIDVADYPPGYGEPGYTGPPVEPVWGGVEDTALIERFGFTRADFPP